MRSIYFILILLCVNEILAIGPDDIAIDRGGVQLKGKFYMAEGPDTLPILILLQGFPGNETDVIGLCGTVSQAGIHVMTFNYSGTFQSQGENNWDNTLQDIKAAFSFIHFPENVKKFRIDTTRVVLGGYSYGGGMALTFAAEHPEIKRIITIAGNDHGAFMKEYGNDLKLKEFIDELFSRLRAPGGPVRFARGGTPAEVAELKILEQNPKYDLVKMAPSLADKDILLIGGWDDEQVKIENNILPFYRALKRENSKNVSMVAYPDTHSFKNSRPAIANKIIEWIKTVR